ncbi:unnamed protein product [Rhizoctonia solani]|uniref:Uncharacterized protein n=1 Tax=Rhizoctonia solani TaxID=456999 RepID=A0A8H3AI16_9AGAM|nr:unnamed protein product [Rhizoctonia solani]
MRTSASFAALVTMIAIVGTTAAPIGDNPGSGHVHIPVGGHQPNHGVFPVSGFKISDRDMSHTISNCESKPILDKEIKPVVAVDGKVKDMGKTPQDEIHVPDISAHVGIDINTGGDKNESQHQPHPEPQPRPGSQPQPQPEPQPESQTGPESKPQSESSPEPAYPGNTPGQPQGNAGSCVDPSNVHEGLQADACAMVELKDGKEALDAIDKSVDKTGDEVKAKAAVVLDKAHKVHDKPMNVAHDVEKGAHIAGKMDIDLDTDTVKVTESSYKPALTVTKEEIGGASLTKDIKRHIPARSANSLSLPGSWVA